MFTDVYSSRDLCLFTIFFVYCCSGHGTTVRLGPAEPSRGSAFVMHKWLHQEVSTSDVSTGALDS